MVVVSPEQSTESYTKSIFVAGLMGRVSNPILVITVPQASVITGGGIFNTVKVESQYIGHVGTVRLNRWFVDPAPHPVFVPVTTVSLVHGCVKV
jgi:hypothetical protein